MDQAVFLTQDIEDCFEVKRKTGAALVDLTAAYDSVWYLGLTCKLLSLLPDKYMIRMIMEHVRNRSFTFTNGNGKQSWLQRPKNGFLLDSVLPPPSCITSTISRKHEVCLRR